MTFDEHRKPVSEDTETDDLAKALQALLEEARGNWNRAHGIAQLKITTVLESLPKRAKGYHLEFS